jgi:hypothetical protein
MLRRAGGIGFMLGLAGCTSVVLHDVHDAGQSDAVPKDAWSIPETYCGLIGSTKAYTYPQAAQLLVLLDRSESMQTTFDGTTRELAAQNALITTITKYQSEVLFGFEQFPTSADSTQCQPGTCCAGTCCAEPVYSIPTGSNIGAMTDRIQCAGSHGAGCLVPSLDSPSHKALAAALDYFNSPKSKSYPGQDRYVLLVTSSDPSCAAESHDVCPTALRVVSELINNADVRIVVLSVGYAPDQGSCLYRISQTGSSWTTGLNIQPLYTANSRYDLAHALDEFVSAVAQSVCTVSTSPIPDGAQLNVSLDSTNFHPTDGNNQDGWSYADGAHTSIKWSGSACSDYMRSTTKNLVVSYPCSYCDGPFACYQSWP